MVYAIYKTCGYVLINKIHEYNNIVETRLKLYIPVH